MVVDEWHKQDLLMCLGEILADFYVGPIHENAATMKDLELRVDSKGDI